MFIIINSNYINTIILEIKIMNQTPEEYYNRKSKQESSKIAGYCFIGAMILLIITFIAEILH